ncbi:alpha/beta hydrolase family protein [Sphingoaurantiacus capsulatus]|uniref:Alpha/beta hydrolase family protein n=1 Tax=Sphingoaurantiacus capsulatus TaxID=1771310 RepID=A0ABV7XC61_9SPHN
MSRFITRAALVALVTGTLAAPAQAQMADLAVKFGAREAFNGVALSPDGSRISYLNPVAGRATAVVVVDIKSGAMKPVLSTSDPNMRINWCDWIKMDRIACQMSGERRDIGDNFGISRMIAVNADGSEMKEIGARQTARAVGVNSYGGTIIDYLPDDPDNILMEVYKLPEESVGTLKADTEGGLTVVSINSRTGRSRTVEGAVPNGGDFMSDRRGRVRLRSLAEMKDTASYTSYSSGTYRWFYRPKTSNNWVPLGISNARDVSTLEVLGFDESGDNILALKPHNGRQALFKIAADGSNREELLFAQDQVDVSGIKRIGKYFRPVGANYSSDYNHIEYFDPALEKLAASLGRALPGKPEINVIDETWDGSKLLLFAGTDVNPGAYYLFDKATKSLGKLSDTRPGTDGMKFGEMTPVRYTARDGASIPGYLTLPPGKDGKNLPTIILPHGGPSARDTWGFDWLVQYFSQLGYAVLQPNYRGSAGYGEAWLQQNGFKAWRTSIGDINDGARWLVAQGIADPKRMAIFGWSYGGYAALQANVVEPDLYKATIAVAPVTDLYELKEQSRYFGSFLINKDFIGAGPHVTEGSPAKNAAAIKTPVLMFHGDKDLNVDIRQAKLMESALKSAGKPVELIVYPNLQHSLIDSGARADLLLRSAKFLAANVPQ